MSNGEAAKPAAKGMAGLVVADSSISFVDGADGILEYRGHDIRRSGREQHFEEVAYLLWNGHLPTANELADMKRQSRACRLCRRRSSPCCATCPRTPTPMAVMRSASLHAGALRPRIRG